MKLLGLIIILLVNNVWGSNENQTLIKVGEAKLKKGLVALSTPYFIGNTNKIKNHASLGNEIYQVVYQDLSRVGYFKMQDPSSFIEEAGLIGLKPFPSDSNGFRWENWKSIGSDYLIRTGFQVINEKFELDAYVYDINKRTAFLSKKYQGSLKDLRRVVHTFTDDFVFTLTGRRSFFLSRIVVSINEGKTPEREIYIMDWDGANRERVSNDKTLTLSPSWSLDGKKISYTAFLKRDISKARNADLLVFDLASRTSKRVSYRKGINSGAVFHPDGNSMFLTMSGEGNPDIYNIDMTGKILKRITSGPMGAMNVEPAVSPDGKYLAYSSDRAGRPMIYILNLEEGGDPKRLTFAGSFNAAPSWSHDGNKIAFSGWANRNFDIYTIDRSGSNLKKITEASKSNGRQASNENPSFSPDGRVIIYTSQRNGFSHIYLSLADGSEEWQITSDAKNYFQPKWSSIRD